MCGVGRYRHPCISVATFETLTRGMSVPARDVAVIAAVFLGTAPLAAGLAFAVSAPRFPGRTETGVAPGCVASLVAVVAIGAPIVVVVAVLRVTGVRVAVAPAVLAAVVIGATPDCENGEQYGESGGHVRLCRRFHLRVACRT